MSEIILKNKEIEAKYDVIICGAGLAGLTLVRQLSLENMNISILVIDRLTRPLKEGAFKVGESTIEVAAYYLSKMLNLEDLLDDEHYEKLGLRYFFQNKGKSVAYKPEYGVADYLPVKSYQIDRGKFENSLREIISKDKNVTLIEGAKIKDIEINASTALNYVIIEDAENKIKKIYGKWVIDGTGRNRIIQRKYKHSKDLGTTCSSAWFRIKGRLDIDKLVEGDENGWYSRVNKSRWFSTNHFMGKGYWIWFIPLSSNHTSVGIVTSETIHPLKTYGNHAAAIDWIRQNEPEIARFIEDKEIEDFKKLPNYSLSSYKIFSSDRWACTGEAGVFPDPFYSPGSNMISYTNTFITSLIKADLAGSLNEETIDYGNSYIISLSEYLTTSIQVSYQYHDNGTIMALKIIWDYFIGWGLSDPQFYYKTFLDRSKSSKISSSISRIIHAQAKIWELLLDWSNNYNSTFEFSFIDYIEDIPTLRKLFLENLPSRIVDFEDYVKNMEEAISLTEELAHVIFYMAIEDCYPEYLYKFDNGKKWINIQAISLNPEMWDKESLFNPSTTPRNLDSLTNEIRSLFTKVKNLFPTTM